MIRELLTKQEYKVASLAARGLTNKTVASQLYSSQKTIECHLNNVYKKLKIKGRIDLTRLFVEDLSVHRVKETLDDRLDVYCNRAMTEKELAFKSGCSIDAASNYLKKRNLLVMINLTLIKHILTQVNEKGYFDLQLNLNSKINTEENSNICRQVEILCEENFLKTNVLWDNRQLIYKLVLAQTEKGKDFIELALQNPKAWNQTLNLYTINRGLSFKTLYLALKNFSRD